MTPIDVVDVVLTEVLSMHKALFPKCKDGEIWRRTLADLVDLGLAQSCVKALEREYQRAE